MRRRPARPQGGNGGNENGGNNENQNNGNNGGSGNGGNGNTGTDGNTENSDDNNEESGEGQSNGEGTGMPEPVMAMTPVMMTVTLVTMPARMTLGMMAGTMAKMMVAISMNSRSSGSPLIAQEQAR